MKFCRIGAPGKEVPAIIDPEGRARSLAGIVSDIDAAFIAGGHTAILGRDVTQLPLLGAGRIGACVANPGKIVCVGLNYADHARESGLPVPTEPVLFMKACRATGPDDDIELPRAALKTDWEVELAIVIGKETHYVSEDQVADHIAGYCVMNDVSERAFQHERGGQWMKGKSSPGFAPLGPWLVTRDEIADSGNLRIWLEVNGKRHQDGSTRDLIFSISTIVSYASQFMTFYPGDIISTGTPAGVGGGLKPPTFLKAGDVVTVGIDGLGTQRHRFVSPSQ